MPGKSKSADTATLVSDEAIRQRAYYLWEQDGRPDGRGDHYWHLAHDEAHRAMVDDTATRTAKITRGKNPADIPAKVKAGNKSAKLKVRAADSGKGKAKKTPKPRAAIQKSL